MKVGSELLHINESFKIPTFSILRAQNRPVYWKKKNALAGAFSSLWCNIVINKVFTVKLMH